MGRLRTRSAAVARVFHRNRAHAIAPTTAPAAANLKQQKRALIARHCHPRDLTGLAQVAATLLPLAALWAGVYASTRVSYGLTAALVLLMSLFMVRVFVLMHECGHGSLFGSPRLNHAFGFVFGVLCGMPAYVWSQHHQHHHATNGNWAKYRGPLNIIAADEYAAMTFWQQGRYRHARTIWLAPLGGFLYLIFNPRATWLRGTAGLLAHLLLRKIAQPGVSLHAHARTFETRDWSSAQEYRHMAWNNLALLGLWGVMAWLMGPWLFFGCYIISVSLAGAAGLVLFTVQHNFEHAYASHNQGWDFDAAVIGGTSFLQLPRWLNWFTVNIGYHHIHHLSATIPNYCLAACHNENQHLFAGVKRIRLWQIPHALKHILWDTHGRRIVSIAGHKPQATR
jgi:acyl-lipid omega-6 desaturase (Delta-12 desaturase)